MQIFLYIISLNLLRWPKHVFEWSPIKYFWSWIFNKFFPYTCFFLHYPLSLQNWSCILYTLILRHFINAGFLCLLLIIPIFCMCVIFLYSSFPLTHSFLNLNGIIDLTFFFSFKIYVHKNLHKTPFFLILSLLLIFYKKHFFSQI